MRHRLTTSHGLRAVVACIVVCAALVACNTTNTGGGTPSTTQPANGVPALTWNTSPDAVIFRVDRQVVNAPPFDDLNRLPLCTLYGDGRVVWVNALRPSGEEVLEALIDPAQMRSFLDYLIGEMQFYAIPDYASLELPPSDKTGVDSLTLTLTEQARTLRNYKLWPNDVYALILEKCRTLSSAPVRIDPSGGWVTVYAGPSQTLMPYIDWPDTAPFRMAEAASSAQAQWVTEVALRMLWQTQRETQGNILWREAGVYYQVAVQVPGISRQSPPAPSTPPTPQP
jgi:hypothetical protein